MFADRCPHCQAIIDYEPGKHAYRCKQCGYEFLENELSGEQVRKEKLEADNQKLRQEKAEITQAKEKLQEQLNKTQESVHDLAEQMEEGQGELEAFHHSMNDHHEENAKQQNDMLEELRSIREELRTANKKSSTVIIYQNPEKTAVPAMKLPEALALPVSNAPETAVNGNKPFVKQKEKPEIKTKKERTEVHSSPKVHQETAGKKKLQIKDVVKYVVIPLIGVVLLVVLSIWSFANKVPEDKLIHYAGLDHCPECGEVMKCRKLGDWLGNWRWVCSACNFKIAHDDLLNMLFEQEKTDYCPDCGVHLVSKGGWSLESVCPQCGYLQEFDKYMQELYEKLKKNYEENTITTP